MSPRPLRHSLLPLMFFSLCAFGLTEQPSAEGEDELPQAENIQLDQPLADEDPAAEAVQQPRELETQEGETQEQESQEREPQTETEEAPEESAPAEDRAEETSPDDTQETAARALRLLGAEVPPATSTRLSWSPSQHFEGVYSATPVLVVNGAEPGPVLCLTAAIHGDELNGIETVRRVMHNLNPKSLSGAVIGVPIVNMQGFQRSSRYLADRRDLNRHFPGDPRGSLASRIAHSFFHEVVAHCNAVVDIHTGSFYRTNLPQLRGDLSDPKVVKLTQGFGSTVVLHSGGARGTLRHAAVNAGIPTVTLEAGAPMVLEEDAVSHSVKGIRTLLHQLGMVSRFRLWGDPEPVYYNSTWQRATTGGMIFSSVKLGQSVRKGDLLGTVTNPITNVRTEIRSQHNGRVLGMAMDQVVQPGFAAYHIGIQAPQEQISAPEEVTADSARPAAEPQAENDAAQTVANGNGLEMRDEPGDDGEPDPEILESDD